MTRDVATKYGLKSQIALRGHAFIQRHYHTKDIAFVNVLLL